MNILIFKVKKFFFSLTECLLIEDICDESDDEFDDENENRFQIMENVRLETISKEVDRNNDERMLGVTPGVACFLTYKTRQTPHVFENYIRLVRSIPQRILFLKIQYARAPFIPPEQRLLIKFYENIYHITATFGYAETKNKSVYNDILLLAKELYQLPICLNENQITFYLPNERINLSKIGWKSYLTRWPLYFYSIQKKLVPRESINIKINPKNTILIGIIAEL